MPLLAQTFGQRSPHSRGVGRSGILGRVEALARPGSDQPGTAWTVVVGQVSNQRGVSADGFGPGSRRESAGQHTRGVLRPADDKTARNQTRADVPLLCPGSPLMSSCQIPTPPGGHVGCGFIVCPCVGGSGSDRPLTGTRVSTVLAFENPASQSQRLQILLAVPTTALMNSRSPSSVIFAGDSVKPQSTYRSCSRATVK